MTGLQNRVFLHWQGNGIKHGLKPLSSEEREERKKQTNLHKGGRKVRVDRTHRDELRLLGNMIRG